MKIYVLASGSRGDVQPAIALAARLAARGADVKLVAPDAGLAAARGFAFHPIPVDIAEAMTSPESERFFRGGGLTAFIRWMAETNRKYFDTVVGAVVEGGAGADLIVATGLMDTLGGMLATRLGVPCAHAWWSAMIAAADFFFAASERAPARMPGFASRAIFHAFEQALWLGLRPTLAKAPAFGLPRPGWAPPLGRAVARGEPLLLAYSGALLPRSREWPANVETRAGGFSTTERIGRRPPRSRAFWTRGRRPSMSASDRWRSSTARRRRRR